MGMNLSFVTSLRRSAQTLALGMVAMPVAGQLPLFCGEFSLNDNSFDVGDTPGSLVVGDLDGDGTLDFVVANRGEFFSTGNDLSVLLGKGDGTFLSESRYPTGNNPSSVELGDLNGDGVLDLVVSNAGDFFNELGRDVSVLIGNGDGTFQPEQRFGVGDGPEAVAIGDLDGDGIADIAVVNFFSIDVSVLLGNGDGSFQPEQRFGVGIDPVAVAIGDLNGDGALDLAVANAFDDDVSVLLGNGDGTFQIEQRFGTGDFPNSIAIRDLDYSGTLDLAVSNASSDDLSILLGNGDGTFQPDQVFAVGDTPGSVVIDDLNGDGVPDVALVNSLSNDVSVLLGIGDGTFHADQRFAAGDAPSSVVTGDMNGDGVPDLVVANAFDDNVRVLLGNVDGMFSGEPTVAVGDFPRGVAMADFDNDGIPDLASANRDSNQLSVTFGNVDGTFGPASFYPVGQAPVTVTAGDFNGDGLPDLFLPSAVDDIVNVFESNGDRTFTPRPSLAVGNEPREVAVGNLNGDSFLDIAVANTASDDVTVYYSNGDGTFTFVQSLSSNNGSGFRYRRVAIGDLTGDGEPEIAALNQTGMFAGIRYWSKDLDDVEMGDFLANDIGNVMGDDNQGFALGDIDGDNDLDYVVSQRTGPGVTVRLNNGNGTFGFESPVYGTGPLPRDVVLMDIDGDGYLDAITANRGTDDISILINNGDGTFLPETRLNVGDEPWGLATGDLDNNGTDDLVVANGGSDTISLFISTRMATALFTGTSGGSSNLVDPDNWTGGVTPSIEAPFAAVFDASSASLLSIETLGLTGPASFRALALASGTIRLNLNGQSLDLLGFESAQGPIGLELGVEQCGGPDPLPSAEPVFRFFNDDFFDGSVTTTRATIGALGPATLEIQDNATVSVLDALAIGGSGRGTVQIEDVDALLEYGDVSMQPPVPALRAVVGTRDLGLVDISDGGKVDGAAETLVLGKGFTGDGRIFVSGNGSRWKHTGDEVIIGDNGHGEIRVLNGGDFESLINDRIVLAQGKNASAAIEVGDGSSWVNSGIGTVVVGGEGTATVTVDGSGIMLVPGLDNTANGTLQGDGTLLTDVVNYGDLIVGSTDPERGNAAGTMAIDGDYDQFDDPQNPEISGRVLIDAFESGGSVTTDMLSISGEANLAGGLIVTSVASLDPGAITSTPVLQAGSVNGRFDVAFLPGVLPDQQGDGRYLRVEYPVPVRSDDGSARGVVTVNLVVDTLENSIELDSAEAFDVNGSPVAADVGDLNNDELIDVALVLPDETDPTGAPGDALVLFNAGSFGDIWGGFASSVQFDTPPDPSDIAIGNIDAPGGLDLAVSSRAINAVRLYTNDGAGVFSVDQDIVISGPASSVVFGELDEDKWDDLIIANPENNAIEVVDNTLGGVFDPPVPVPVGASVSNVTASDLDGNGFDDVVTTNPGDGTLSVVLRNLDGTFQPAVDLPAVGTPGSVVLLDLDDDGDLDIAYTSDDASGTNTVQVLRNDLTDGQVIFSPDAAISTGGNPVYLFSADVDSDGQEDLLTLNADSGARGAASFNDVSVVRQSAALCAGDCNNDGSVNFSDLVAMLGEFGTLGTNPGCDPDQSGTVDFSDLVMALGVFGACP